MQINPQPHGFLVKGFTLDAETSSDRILAFRAILRDPGSTAPLPTVGEDALASIQKEDHLPLVVVGVDRYLAFYQEVTRNPDAIAAV